MSLFFKSPEKKLTMTVYPCPSIEKGRQLDLEVITDISPYIFIHNILHAE